MIKAVKSLKEQITQQLQTKIEDIDLVLFDSGSGIHLKAEDFYTQYNPEELQKGHCTVVGKIEVKNDALAMFMLKDMIGCAGLLIFHDLYVLPEFRRLKIGTSIFEFIKEFAIHYGYGMIQSTDNEDNVYSGRIFVSKGWTKGPTFKNPKTGNNICIWNLKLG